MSELPPSTPKFPTRPYQDCGTYGDDYFQAVARAHASVDRQALNRAAALLTDAIGAGRTLFSCGNGGSAAIANHLVCDCLKGIRTDTTVKPVVHSLVATMEVITAIANDMAYDQVFAYQVQSYVRPGDVLIAISSSGNSPNILNALTAARGQGAHTIALTGFTGGGAATLADVNLHVDAHNYGVVEDVHQSIMHLLAQFLRLRHLTDPTLAVSRPF
ncbi:D-sedoheptulose-7-phosphate isomerase [Nitrospirillum iridis]|uniref:Phosphoheptose isomerase n=1 Tax=Nitrospirillum iridis TaxID=765888 RepID=A0A7X0ED26_9PROT|nr:SIS domain-containing protein [Nitrospirillum iridis]MBB6252298.1 phosphoheptose isomerase [Nitrospirillum iridis]